MKTAWITKTLAVLTVLALAFCAIAAAPAAALANQDATPTASSEASAPTPETPAVPKAADSPSPSVEPSGSATPTPTIEAEATPTATPTTAPTPTPTTALASGQELQYKALSTLVIADTLGGQTTGTDLQKGASRSLRVEFANYAPGDQVTSVNWSSSSPAVTVYSTSNYNGIFTATITGTSVATGVQIRADITGKELNGSGQVVTTTVSKFYTLNVVAVSSATITFTSSPLTVYVGTGDYMISSTHLQLNGYLLSNITMSCTGDGSVFRDGYGNWYYKAPTTVGTGAATITATEGTTPNNTATLAVVVRASSAGSIYFNPTYQKAQENGGSLNANYWLVKGGHPSTATFSFFSDAACTVPISSIGGGSAFYSTGFIQLPRAGTHSTMTSVWITASVPASSYGNYPPATALPMELEIYPASAGANLSTSVSQLNLTVSSINAFTTGTFTVSTTGTAAILSQVTEGSAHINLQVVQITPGAAGTSTVSYQVTGLSQGIAKIRFYAADVYEDKYVTIIVGNPTPVVRAWYAPYTALNKTSQTYTMLYVHVDNAPVGAQVTIYRSNIRTYAKDYTTHPSTYNYTATLNAAGDTAVCIYPQYNGDTYYTVTYGGVTTNAGTLRVSGFTTLPQTGPNYTWAYILGGLCLAVAATAVTLNVRKKKKSDN